MLFNVYSMLDRLAEVIFNGGAPICILILCILILCIKLDSSFLRLLKICRISFNVCIITIVHLFNRQ